MVQSDAEGSTAWGAPLSQCQFFKLLSHPLPYNGKEAEENPCQ